ncbi:hypothetical protein GLOIN_2v1884393 [Rhizophagus clarus]|uniref:Uncharacterized protein n=1 Tax=Rhizophagus clarus TaxID=94130 RepID=A0A8H3KPQ1_9GLOM|nr:hypothetical protein GLOIN_2v1884393 [Rhizophagus clarus]
MTRLFEIKVRKGLPDEKHDQTFEIKDCQMKNMTGLLKLRLSDEKHDWTFEIEGWLTDEKHDQTFEIEGCQMENMTRPLKLRLPDEKYDQTFENKVEEGFLLFLNNKTSYNIKLFYNE